jgi:hypothetical protein
MDIIVACFAIAGFVIGCTVSASVMLLYMHITRRAKYLTSHSDPFSHE